METPNNQTKEPWYKKRWGISLVVFAFLFVFLFVAVLSIPINKGTYTNQDKETKQEVKTEESKETTKKEEPTKPVEEEKEKPTSKLDYKIMSVWDTVPKLNTVHYALLSENDSKSNVVKILKEIGKKGCNKEFCKIVLWSSEDAFRTADDLNDYQNTFSIFDVSGPPAGYWDDDSDYYLYYDKSFKFD